MSTNSTSNTYPISRFHDLSYAEPIERGALSKAFSEDAFENKVNLSIRTFKTDTDMSVVLPVVRVAEIAIANDDTLNKEYLPILGLDIFSKLSTELLLGKDSPALLENRAFGVQVISGSGGLRVGAEFFCTVMDYTTVYFSNPTWDNHQHIFKQAGFEDIRYYTYWSSKLLAIDFEGMVHDLREAPENAIIVLQTNGHNPTGCDPTKKQWEIIAKIIMERNLVPFFDCCFQGYVTGNLVEDAYPVRLFVEKGIEFLTAQSFSKTFLLFNERVGNLVFVLNDEDRISRIKSHLTHIIRGMYSNPPCHGARVVTFILNNPQLYEQWKKSLATLSARTVKMRKILRDTLESLLTPGDWSFLTRQVGMCAYTGLNMRQCEHMMKKHHVYMFKNGKINVCGLTPRNVEYVAKAINETVNYIRDN